MFLLQEHRVPFFPHPFLATEDGLLAVGGNLEVNTLIQAYSSGIFPWFNAGDPIVWWFLSPRCVLYPTKIKVSKSMQSILKKEAFDLRFDHDFASVIEQCKTVKRLGQEDTWITNDMKQAYVNLHKAGHAHSVEVYENNQLVGGLYGVCIGKVFYGESMFSLAPNTSKLALIFLAKRLAEAGFIMIDCQQETKHLISMGAEMIDKEAFWKHLMENQKFPRKSMFY